MSYFTANVNADADADAIVIVIVIVIIIVIPCGHRLSYFVVAARFIVTSPLQRQVQVQVIAYCMSITRELTLAFCMIWGVQLKNQGQRANYLTE